MTAGRKAKTDRGPAIANLKHLFLQHPQEILAIPVLGQWLGKSPNGVGVDEATRYRNCFLQFGLFQLVLGHCSRFDRLLQDERAKLLALPVEMIERVANLAVDLSVLGVDHPGVCAHCLNLGCKRIPLHSRLVDRLKLLGVRRHPFVFYISRLPPLKDSIKNVFRVKERYRLVFH